MRTDIGARLFAAVGASPAFVDDVLGDLHELRAQRRRTGETAGQVWYVAEVLRALPHAVRDGLRGTGRFHVLDWGQKALAAWLLLGTAVLIGGAMSFGLWATLTPPASRPRVWFPSDAFMVVLLAAGTLRLVLLGYVAAWLERERPLLVTVLTALIECTLHVLLLHHHGRELGAGIFVVPVIAATLITGGGVWRVLRADITTSPRADQHRS